MGTWEISGCANRIALSHRVWKDPLGLETPLPVKVLLGKPITIAEPAKIPEQAFDDSKRTAEAARLWGLIFSLLTFITVSHELLRQQNYSC